MATQNKLKFRSLEDTEIEIDYSSLSPGTAANPNSTPLIWGLCRKLRSRKQILFASRDAMTLNGSGLQIKL